MGKLLNIGVNSLKRQNLLVMADKALGHWKIKRNDPKTIAALRWYRERAEPLEDYVRSLDASLWIEAQEVCGDFARRSQDKLRGLNLDLGGGGHYPLLYFLTRLIKPVTVVETGVAAGWSSAAILLGLRENGVSARLYSSDFPYFRYKNPEDLVGILVDDELRKGWDLHIDGDKISLPAIVSALTSIDLFHYDSDKTYQGRAFAFRTIEPKLTDKSIVIFDDIQDNSHFYDLVREQRWPCRIFEFLGKFSGLTGPFLANGLSQTSPLPFPDPEP